MHDPYDIVAELETLSTRIASAEGPPDVFRALLEGAAMAAPRSAIYLFRKGVLKGWLCIGYPEEAVRRFRALELPAGTIWPSRLAETGQPPFAVRSVEDAAGAPDFGQAESSECIGRAVRVTGKTLAVLTLEREGGENPWIPSALGLLVEAAQLRLELDLARRKLAKAAAMHSPAAAPEMSSTPEPEPAPAEEEASPAMELASTTPEIAGSEDPARSAARRFARLVATDIRLYNEESVILGRRNRDLANRLKEEIARGRETFLRRFPELGEDGDVILQDAFIQVLAAGDGELFLAE